MSLRDCCDGPMASPFFIWGTCPVVGRHYYGAVLHRQAGIAQRSVRCPDKAEAWVRFPFPVKLKEHSRPYGGCVLA